MGLEALLGPKVEDTCGSGGEGAHDLASGRDAGR